VAILSARTGFQTSRLSLTSFSSRSPFIDLDYMVSRLPLFGTIRKRRLASPDDESFTSRIYALLCLRNG
jgi:hypothetical protein